MILPYDGDDLLYLALEIEVNESHCDRGPHCPSCRLHTAHAQINRKCRVPEDLGLPLLMRLLHQVPDRETWSERERTELLRKMIRNGQY